MNVTARLPKCLFTMDKDKVRETLSVRDIECAKLVQFVVSMGSKYVDWDLGKLDSLTPYEKGHIIYAKICYESSLPEILGVQENPGLLNF